MTPTYRILVPVFRCRCISSRLRMRRKSQGCGHLSLYKTRQATNSTRWKLARRFRFRLSFSKKFWAVVHGQPQSGTVGCLWPVLQQDQDPSEIPCMKTTFPSGNCCEPGRPMTHRVSTLTVSLVVPRSTALSRIAERRLLLCWCWSGVVALDASGSWKRFFSGVKPRLLHHLHEPTRAKVAMS